MVCCSLTHDYYIRLTYSHTRLEPHILSCADRSIYTCLCTESASASRPDSQPHRSRTCDRSRILELAAHSHDKAGGCDRYFGVLTSRYAGCHRLDRSVQHSHSCHNFALPEHRHLAFGYDFNALAFETDAPRKKVTEAFKVLHRPPSTFSLLSSLFPALQWLVSDS